MASDVLLQNANSPCQIPGNLHLPLRNNNYGEKKEPIYENDEILRDFRNNELPKKSVTELYIPFQVPCKCKSSQDDHSYENTKVIKDYIKSHNGTLSREKTVSTLPAKEPTSAGPDQKNLYRSTLSLTLGSKNQNSGESGAQSSLSTPPAVVANSQDVGSPFKSSYAKSLIGSYQNNQVRDSNSLNVTSCINGDDQHIPLEEGLSHREMSLPVTLPSSPHNKKSIEEQKERIFNNLHEKMSSKQEELSRVNKELFTLRLECNRLKAENRSLKVAQTVANRMPSPNTAPGCGSQPNSLTSLSGDVDVWTLQQQVLSLSAQLERAELSRHAYESATRQLVHFLQTINSTLTTVSFPDAYVNNHNVNPLNIRTSDMLQQLQKNIRNSQHMSNRKKSSPPPFPNIKDEDSFSSDINNSTSNPNNSLESDFSEKKPQFKLLIEDCSSASPIKSHDSPKPKINNNEKLKDRLVKPQKYDKDRRFSLSHKLWLSPKRPICRSGSVNELPVEDKMLSQRVSRAVSTQCISSSEPTSDPGVRGELQNEPPSTAVSNKLLSMKARNFFCSLKNIFKADEKTQESSNTLKRKKYFPTFPKLATAKPEISNPIPQYKENPLDASSMHTDSESEQIPHEHSFKSSTFYLSCPACSREEEDGDNCLSPEVTESGRKDLPYEEGLEMSGPHEISVNLTLIEEKETNPRSFTEEENEFIDVPLKDSQPQESASYNPPTLLECACGGGRTVDYWHHGIDCWQRGISSSSPCCSCSPLVNGFGFIGSSNGSKFSPSRNLWKMTRSSHREPGCRLFFV